ncbi:MAG: 2-hydroxyacid dehydrogenase [Clostridia bacterium]|nr:2-hydroxyacid dehydrogenase [Clostridia bacterium]
MKRIAFFDAKPYDRLSFDQQNSHYEIVYFENKLNPQTVSLAYGFDAVCAFVNDTISSEVVMKLSDHGTNLLVMRCAGYSNVDFKTAYNRLTVLRVPAYSPHAVAEHAMALLQTLNRKIHKAYNRTHEFNFSLVGLTGIDLHEKTAGVIGTGKIGQAFINICKGYGMKILAYDPYPLKDSDLNYVSLDELYQNSDIISLHCPLTDDNHHLLNQDAFSKMKRGVFIINTSRGALINSEALLDALNQGIVRGAGLDVYEEEADFFFSDCSDEIIHDDTLALLISRPNVILTSHQGFMTEEALSNIASTTIENLDAYFTGQPLKNEVCYQCDSGKVGENCKNKTNGRCF